PTTEIYTLSLHDALPICSCFAWVRCRGWEARGPCRPGAVSRLTYSLYGWRMIAAYIQFPEWLRPELVNIGPLPIRWYALAYIAGDRKSTRLNSSHVKISY